MASSEQSEAADNLEKRSRKHAAAPPRSTPAIEKSAIAGDPAYRRRFR